MNCWHCERPAHGVCNFCGRGLCRDHVHSLPGIVALYRHKDNALRAVVVEDTLYCGLCRPKESPIKVEELDDFGEVTHRNEKA